MLALPALMNKQGGIPNPDNTVIVNFSYKATSNDFGKCGFFIYDIDSDIVLNKIENTSYAGMWSTSWRMDSEGNAYAAGSVNGYYKLAKVDLLKVQTIANIDYNAYSVQGPVPIVSDKYIYQQANRIADNKPCVIRINKSDMTVESIYVVPGATNIQILESYNKAYIWILSTSANSTPCTWNTRKWEHTKSFGQVVDHASGSATSTYNVSIWDVIGVRWHSVQDLFMFGGDSVGYKNPTDLNSAKNVLISQSNNEQGPTATFDLINAYYRRLNAYGDSYNFYEISYTSAQMTYERKSGILNVRDLTKTKDHMLLIPSNGLGLYKRSSSFKDIGSTSTYVSEQIFDISNATHRAKFFPSTTFYSGYLATIHNHITSRIRLKAE